MRPHVAGLLFVAATAFAGSQEAAQTLRAKPIPCELDAPASWKVVSDEGYRIVAVGDGAGLMLAATEDNLGDPSAAVKVGREMATKQDPNAKVTEPAPITIDGHKWLQFTTTSTHEGDILTFLVYSYSGSEGTFVVIGYTAADQFQGKRLLLTHYMNTFRFPKSKPTPSNGSNQSMKPTQHFVVSFSLMRAPIFKVLGGLSLSR